MTHPMPTALHFLGTLAISTLIVAAVITLAIALLRLLSDRVQVIDVCDGCGRRMDQHKMALRPDGVCSGMCFRCFDVAFPAPVMAASSTVDAIATPTPDDRAVLIRQRTDAMAIPILPGFEDGEETGTYGPPKDAA